jgi:hypothetical protein
VIKKANFSPSQVFADRPILFNYLKLNKINLMAAFGTDIAYHSGK